MSLFRFSSVKTVRNSFERLWDQLGFTTNRKPENRKRRTLAIDPLEERNLLSVTYGESSVTAGSTITLETGAVSTVGAQSVATDDNGDTVVCWTGTDTIYDDETGTYYTDENVYAEYLTYNTQEITLAENTKSFYLIYGGTDTDSDVTTYTMTERLTLSTATSTSSSSVTIVLTDGTTVTYDSSSSANIVGTITLQFKDVDGNILTSDTTGDELTFTLSYDESDYLGFAEDLQTAMRNSGNSQLATANVTAVDSLNFDISYACAVEDGSIVDTSGSKPTLVDQNYICIDQDQTSFSSGYLAAAEIEVTSAPILIGKVTVSQSNAADTVTVLTSYLEGATEDEFGTEYTAPTVVNLPIEVPSLSDLGLDVTVTSVSTQTLSGDGTDPLGLWHFYVTFTGTQGYNILDKLSIVNATDTSGADVTDLCSVKIIKQSSEIFRVNPTEINDDSYGLDNLTDQYSAAVAMDGDGNFIITWVTDTDDGTNVGTSDIYARRFSAASYQDTGTLLGSYNLTTNTLSTDVSATASTLIIISSTELSKGDSITVDGETMSLAGTVSVASASTLDIQIPVGYKVYLCESVIRGAGGTVATTHTGGDDVETATDLWYYEELSAGGAISGKVYVNSVVATAAPYDAQLVLVADDPNQTVSTYSTFVVNTITTGDQVDPSVAIDSEGNFAISWSSKNQNYSYFNEVYVRAFTADGLPVNIETLVSAHDADAHYDSYVTISDTGLVAVAWVSYDPLLVDTLTFSSSVQATLYNWDGTIVNSFDNVYISGGYNPSICFDTKGNFVIAWEVIGDNDVLATSSSGTGANVGVYAREYDAAGAIILDTFRISSADLDDTSSTLWPGYQGNAQVVIDADGDITVSYEGYGADVCYYVSPSYVADYVAYQLTYNDANADIADVLGSTYYERYSTIYNLISGMSSFDVDSAINIVLAYVQHQLNETTTVIGDLEGTPDETADVTHVNYTDTTGEVVGTPVNDIIAVNPTTVTGNLIGTVTTSTTVTSINTTSNITDTADTILIATNTALTAGTYIQIDNEQMEILSAANVTSDSTVSAWLGTTSYTYAYSCVVNRSYNGVVEEHSPTATVYVGMGAVLGTYSLFGGYSGGISASEDTFLMATINSLSVGDTFIVDGETMTVDSVTDFTDEAIILGYNPADYGANYIYSVTVTRGATATAHAEGAIAGQELSKNIGTIDATTTTVVTAGGIDSDDGDGVANQLLVQTDVALVVGATLTIDSETMTVTAVTDMTSTQGSYLSGTNNYVFAVTVTRGTPAAAHSANAAIVGALPASTEISATETGILIATNGTIAVGTVLTIDGEEMLVDEVQDVTSDAEVQTFLSGTGYSRAYYCTVTRGYNGTTAATHDKTAIILDETSTETLYGTPVYTDILGTPYLNEIDTTAIIAADATELVIQSSNAITAGQVIRVGGEEMYVAAVSDQTARALTLGYLSGYSYYVVTVDRAYNNTTAAAHTPSDSATVYNIISDLMATATPDPLSIVSIDSYNTISTIADWIVIQTKEAVAVGTTVIIDGEEVMIDGILDITSSTYASTYITGDNSYLYMCHIQRGEHGSTIVTHDSGATIYPYAEISAEATSILMATDEELQAGMIIIVDSEYMLISAVHDVSDDPEVASFLSASGCTYAYVVEVQRDAATATTHFLTMNVNVTTGGGEFISNYLGCIYDDATHSTDPYYTIIDIVVAEAITDTDTQIVIDTTEPITVGTVIVIDDEEMIVTAIDSTFSPTNYTVATGHYLYSCTVTRAYNNTEAVAHEIGAEVSVYTFSTADISAIVGRIDSVFDDYMDLLRGDSYSILYTQYDADVTAGEVNVTVADATASEERDGTDTVVNIIIESEVSGGTFTLRITGTSVMDTSGILTTPYVDVVVTPVFDDDDNLDIDKTRKAIETAIQSAITALGDAWPSTYTIPGANIAYLLESTVIVRAVTSSEIAVREGTDWAVTDYDGAEITEETAADYVVYEVTFIGSVHDMFVSLGIQKNDLTIDQTEQKTITFSAVGEGTAYMYLEETDEAVEFYFNSDDTETTESQIANALNTLYADQANDDETGYIEVNVVANTDGLVYEVTFMGDRWAGVDLDPEVNCTTIKTADDAVISTSTYYTDFLGRFYVTTTRDGGTVDARLGRDSVITATWGTVQTESSIAMQSDGSFVIAYTQYDQSTNGNLLSTEDGLQSNSIIIRTFDEETDTAGPSVTALETADGTQLLEAASTSIDSSISYLVVDFSEEMYCVYDVETQLNALGYTQTESLVGTIVNGLTLKLASDSLISECETKWEKSVLNEENYEIYLNGTQIKSAVVNVYYGLNEAYILGLSSSGTNKYQVVLVIDADSSTSGKQALSGGSYTLVVKRYVETTSTTVGQSGLCDAAGNPLNQTGYNTSTSGVDTSFAFTITVSSGDTGSTADVPGTPDKTDTDTATNTTETGVESDPVVATAADGTFVLVWVRYGQDSDATTDGNVIGQRYDSEGNKLGSEFIINTYTTGSQVSPAISMADDGSFVVAWSGVGTDGIFGIWGRCYNSKGAATTTSQFQISETSLSTQTNPSVAMKNDGSFVVAWTVAVDGTSETHIYAQRYDINVNQVGSLFRVDSNGNTSNVSADIAVCDTGNFVVTWQSYSSKTGWDIYYKLFNASGAEVTNDTIVNTYTTSRQTDPAVSMSDAGAFVITWTSFGQDAKNSDGVYARRYKTSGAAASSEFRVNATTAGTQYQSDVACDASGNFSITWSSFGQDAVLTKDYGIYCHMYYASGSDYKIDGKTVGEFRVNATTAGNQITPAVSRNISNGDYVVVWVGPDSDATGIFFRRLDPAVEKAVTTSTVGVYNASTGTFYLTTSLTKTSSDKADITFKEASTKSGWTAITGDWNGDGVSTVGLYDASTSTFYLWNSNKAGSTSTADYVFTVGSTTGLQAIVGDWNGDGVDTVGLYNTKTAYFYLLDGNSALAGVTSFKYGSANKGWKAIAGDWNGDGVDTIGTYDYNTATFRLRNSNSAGSANSTFKYGTAKCKWYTPIVGDWDGDGDDTVGLYDYKTAKFYLNNYTKAASNYRSFTLGKTGKYWQPIVGNFTSVSALMAATGELTDSNAKSLTQSQLESLVAEAIARLASYYNLDAATVKKLESVQFVITNLSGSTLGLADGNTISIDSNAAGYGWYVDRTADSDSEYTLTGSGSLKAATAAAVDKIDLLTVLEHELGHVIGLDDVYDDLTGDLMSATLETGTRRAYEKSVDSILGS